ncbi:MAG: hypothetical protein KAT12_00320 [Gammaproteobacteria bacterium]|nr:hypothetical protein [Gammaproteobacteria bacterium]MCK4833175.1 hypothetical protein [Gammaproteobacteria bacterium]
MSLLNKLVFFLLLAGFYGQSFAAVDSFDMESCSVFSESEDDKKEEGGTKEGEEEPDCE